MKTISFQELAQTTKEHIQCTNCSAYGTTYTDMESKQCDLCTDFETLKGFRPNRRLRKKYKRIAEIPSEQRITFKFIPKS